MKQKLSGKELIEKLNAINFKAAYYGIIASTMQYCEEKKFLENISNLCKQKKDISAYVTELNKLGLEDVDDAHAKEFVLQCYKPAIEMVLNSDKHRE